MDSHGRTNLVLNRRIGESFTIDLRSCTYDELEHGITVTIVEIGPRNARLAIKAARSAQITRDNARSGPKDSNG